MRIRNILKTFVNRRVRTDGSLIRHARVAVIGMSVALLILSLFVLAVASINQLGVARLVDHRFGPLSDLQTVTSSYEQALGIANKVQSGNMTPEGGASALSSLQDRIARAWSALDGEVPEQAGGIVWSELLQERESADKGMSQLRMLLERNDRDGLDFFLSGTFYTHVDPLLTASGDYMEGLRGMALSERRTLSAIATVTQALFSGVVVLGIAIGWYVLRLANRKIIIPLSDIASFTAATGLEDEVPHQDRSDEIGDIARAIALAGQRAQEGRRLREQKRAAEAALTSREQAAAEAAQRRAESLDQIFGRSDAELRDLAGGLAAAAQSMRNMAVGMELISGTSQDMATAASRDVDDIAATMTQIEDASTALTGMMGEVEKTIASTREQAASVHIRSQDNRTHANALRQLVQGISGMLDQISGIAQQTDMLALNAAIEASRAGAAGRGFGVVAQEIKQLASQTQAAAREIGEQLGRIADTSDAVLGSVSLVEQMAAGVSRNSDRIVEAVTSQGNSSREIAIAVAHVRGGARSTANGVSELRDSASDVRQSAKGLLETADAIAGKAERLRNAFGRLAEDVRTAA
ncbi:methyl-accepting chemotaxis protein [Sphingobium phenoxybenzoativorans]|uniref:methyl-accepting chemotaxis protein n=1 Tax=Sphingobium phenoxybenzoativorans TaxID=1592790 RepID=UPI001495443E|nr:methyl-accepting chemotaxis protein [Sphingobium phenoxybenzoativorans]